MSEMRYYGNDYNPVCPSSYLFKCQPLASMNNISNFVAMHQRHRHHRLELVSTAYQQNIVKNFHQISLDCSKLATCSDPNLNTTIAQPFQWEGYRDVKKSSSDSTDTESERGKDIISPGIGSSPDPCSPVNLDSTKLRNPSLPNIAHLSRNRFSFETSTLSPSVNGKTPTKLKLVRERSRSESEATLADSSLNRRMVAPQLYKKRILERYTAEVSNKRRKTPPEPMNAEFICDSSYANYRPSTDVNIRRLELPLQRTNTNQAGIASFAAPNHHQKLVTANLLHMNIDANNANISSQESRSSTTDLSTMTGNTHTRLIHRRSRSETDLTSSFVCSYCGQLFEMKDRLLKHIASRHRRNTVFSCEQTQPSTKSHTCFVCQKSFGRSDMLTRHMRLHTGIKPYSCNICSQVFSRSDHLSTHQRTHTGEKPYQCPQCSYSASRRDMITRHLRTHNKQKSDFPIVQNSSEIKKSYVSVIQHIGNAEKPKMVDNEQSLNQSVKMEEMNFIAAGSFTKPAEL